MISKCVMHRNALIRLCFPEIYPCFLTSKEKIPTQKNESSTEARNMHSNIWMYWKVKLIIVFSATLTFGVSIGCLFGMQLSRLRHTKRQKELRNDTCISELYTEIGYSLNNGINNEEESHSEQIELRGITERRLSVSDDQFTGCINEEMDNSYSDIYNVLQPNYG
eukprot:XP_011453362.1 PREDICTED: uncharacterized protein LOC105346489 [Crassostrea gigas]